MKFIFFFNKNLLSLSFLSKRIRKKIKRIKFFSSGDIQFGWNVAKGLKHPIFIFLKKYRLKSNFSQKIKRAMPVNTENTTGWDGHFGVEKTLGGLLLQLFCPPMSLVASVVFLGNSSKAWTARGKIVTISPLLSPNQNFRFSSLCFFSVHLPAPSIHPRHFGFLRWSLFPSLYLSLSLFPYVLFGYWENRVNLEENFLLFCFYIFYYSGGFR